MLDKTGFNTGAAGADETVRRLQPTGRMSRRRSKRRSDVPEQQANVIAKPTSSQPAVRTSLERGSRGRATDDTHSDTASAKFQDGPFKADTQRPVDVLSDDGAQGLYENHNPPSPVIAEFLGGDGAQGSCVSQTKDEPIVSEIVQLWRMRQRWHRAEKALTLQGKAICRAFLGGEKEMASKIFDTRAVNDPMLHLALMPFYKAIENFEPERKKIEKRLRALAQSLPIWPWVKEISGFGPLNLAALVGEAGDIGAYRNPSCLWKRMGMAVIDGGRQRKVSDAEAALIHGYSPPRRAVAYLIGECLVKTGEKCRYRDVYAKRREHTAQTHADWTPKHSHNDAMRIMTKRVLRDLWIEWRRLK